MNGARSRSPDDPAVPMLREGAVIGVITIRRPHSGLSLTSRSSWSQTFADQAVIAIENVRLFTELQDKNEALTQAHAQVTEALDQQTATSEILSVIQARRQTSSPYSTRSWLARLCDGVFASLHRFDGDLLHWVAQHDDAHAEGLEAMPKRFPMLTGRDTASGRAVIGPDRDSYPRL